MSIKLRFNFSYIKYFRWRTPEPITKTKGRTIVLRGKYGLLFAYYFYVILHQTHKPAPPILILRTELLAGGLVILVPLQP